MLESVAQPSDNCCFFYQDIYFGNLMTPQGLCVDHPDQKIDRWVDMSNYGWYNGVGSYSCGKKIRLMLHDDQTGLFSLVAGKVANYDTFFRSAIDNIYMVYDENPQYLNMF